MITRFLRAFRSALLSIPFNPYGTIDTLRARIESGQRDLRKAQTACRRLRTDKGELQAQILRLECNTASVVKNWTKVCDGHLRELEAHEAAIEAFMVEREALKAEMDERTVAGLYFAQAATESEGAYREVVSNLPYLKAVEDRLASVGITVAGGEGGVPQIMLNFPAMSQGIRAHEVILAA